MINILFQNLNNCSKTVTKDFPKERYCTPYLSLVPRNVNLK